MPRPRRPGLTLGTYSENLEPGGVMGVHVATYTAIRQMVREPALERVRVFTNNLQRRFSERSIAVMQGEPPPPRPEVILADKLDLLRDPHAHPVSAWHLPDGEMAIGLAHRRHLGHVVPITAPVHSFCYPSLVHGTFLQLLLSDLRSCDSLISSTVASQRALANLLEHIAEEFRRAYGAKIAFRGRLDRIPLGVDTEIFQPRDRKAARAETMLPLDRFILLYLGRVSAAGKADLVPLLQVFAELRRGKPRRKPLLVIAGEAHGPTQALLEQQVQALGLGADVLFSGPVKSAPQMYAAADVFVSPVENLQEAYGLTPVEAMACGIPQVVTDWDGYRDTVVDGKTGFLIPTYLPATDEELLFDWYLDSDHGSPVLAQETVVDQAALLAALRRLLEDDSLRKKMGAASRKRAVEHFGWDVVMKQYVALWDELVTLAAREAPPDLQRDAHARPDPLRCFSGYATRILSDDARVRITHRGLLQRQEAPLFVPFARAGKSRDALATEVLQALRLQCGQDGSTTLRRVLEAVASEGPRSTAQVRRRLLWLQKYGFAEAVPDPSPKAPGRKRSR